MFPVLCLSLPHFAPLCSANTPQKLPPLGLCTNFPPHGSFPHLFSFSLASHQIRKVYLKLHISPAPRPLRHFCTGVGKGWFTVVCMEKDIQVMIITIALLTQNNVTVQLQTRFCPPDVLGSNHHHLKPCNFINSRWYAT